MKHLLVILTCILTFSCNSPKQEDSRLIGKWDGSLKVSKTGSSLGKIVLEFTNDGKFFQHMEKSDIQNTVESTYELQGDKIITVDNDTKEKAEGKYVIKNDTLTITFEGVDSKYVKIK